MLRRSFLLFTGFCAVLASLGRLFSMGWAKQPNRSMQNAPVKPDMDSFGTIDFLFKDTRFYPRMPAAVEAVVKDRLSRAETEYRQGRRPGVREQSIADAFNMLAAEFNAPDYFFTSQRQVRFERMQMALSFSKFMEIDEINESVAPEMSPLQAAYVMKALTELKLVAPEYQIQPVQWDQSYQQMMANLQRAQQSRRRLEELRKQGVQFQGRLRSESRPTKYKELYDILSQRVSFLSPSDGQDLINRTLTILGI